MAGQTQGEWMCCATSKSWNRIWLPESRFPISHLGEHWTALGSAKVIYWKSYSELRTRLTLVIAAMQAGDIGEVKLGVLGFSHQVSDAFSIQPPEFKALAGKIAEIKRIVA